MKVREPFELPRERREDLGRARRLEWTTLPLMLSVIAAVYLTMGSSQAMKAAWIEDMLSLVPPIAFLVADRFARREPTPAFPYGYHRAVSIAFLAGAVALTLLGAFILTDSVLTLIAGERPSIGTRVILGQQVWSGWLMVAALVWGAIVPFVLGRMKLPLARSLHDKTLKADADMNRADWLTSGAGIAGITGIAFGLWWADAVAAGLISFSILNDGLRNLRRVVQDLMDRRPVTVDGEVSDLPEKVREAVASLGWVREADVRLREEGHVYTGEAFVVAAEGEGDAARRLREASEAARGADWRIHDIVVMLVDTLRSENGGGADEQEAPAGHGPDGRSPQAATPPSA